MLRQAQHDIKYFLAEMNPEQIQWKYFYKNPDGSTTASYEEPGTSSKKIAPLLLNLGCGPKENYHNAFQKLVAEGLCICVP
ncbi:MAG: hypothetical protein KGP29_02065 [Proteobacteria bacterium]|nr:hypothetical protein [Pseudomonadota bacterium]